MKFKRLNCKLTKDHHSYVCVVVQFYPWFKFYSQLFQTHYHTFIISKNNKKIKFKPRINLNHNICNLCSCEKKAPKNSGLNRIQTHDLWNTGVVLYQLNCRAKSGSQSKTTTNGAPSCNNLSFINYIDGCFLWSILLQTIKWCHKMFKTWQWNHEAGSSRVLNILWHHFMVYKS